MNSDLDIRPVLARYPADCQPVAEGVQWLDGAGGFSGAKFWRLTTPQGFLCLRRWPPEHPSADRLGFIHAVLAHVCRGGFQAVPVPLRDKRGGTFVRHAEHLWELAPWMPGRADYLEGPSRARLQAALEALARFHLAAATFEHGGGDGTSPGLAARRVQLHEFSGGGASRLASAAVPLIWPELAELMDDLFQRFESAAHAVSLALDEAAEQSVRLQPCLRDIWHDHVLFEQDRVSGIVDFGAMRKETVAGDIARLLGSLCEDDVAGWQAGLTAYTSLRPLSEVEERLIRVFDQTTVLMSGLNWIDWLFVQQRDFGTRQPIITRLETIARRLAHLAEQTTRA